MNITSKKVITIYEVEITFQEFWDNLECLIQDQRAERNTFLLGKQYQREKLNDFINYVDTKLNGSLTMEVARNHFTNLTSEIKDIVISYIANAQGYNVQHYGLYYKHEGIYRATFQRNGNRI